MTCLGRAGSWATVQHRHCGETAEGPSSLPPEPPDLPTRGQQKDFTSVANLNCPPARMCCVSDLRSESVVPGSLTWQHPRSSQALQSEAPAACKPIHQRPQPKLLLILQMLQISRNLQSSKQKEKHPWKQQEGVGWLTCPPGGRHPNTAGGQGE